VGTAAISITDPSTGFPIFGLPAANVFEARLELAAQGPFEVLQVLGPALGLAILVLVLGDRAVYVLRRRSRNSNAISQSVEQTTCPICGGTTKSLFRTSDQRHGTPGDFEIVQCRECGLAVTLPQHSSFEAQDYPESYVTESLQWGYLTLSYQLVAARVSGSFEYVNMLLLPDRTPGRLLDIGCGSGTYIRQMAERGWNCEGLEPNHFAAKEAIKSGINVIESDLSSAQLPRGSFDAITLIHTLEHIPSPEDVISTCSSLLVPEGVLLIAVPNFDSAGRRFFEGRWDPLEAPRHLYHFAEKSLRHILERNGFTVIQTAYDNRLGHVVQSLVNMFFAFIPLRIRKALWLRLLVGMGTTFLDLTVAPLLNCLRASSLVNIAVLAQKPSANDTD
jgi:2-polyprenyl-3-methyl-5-hydroxy-6-metoxy-1,4-benzoquinol methylase